MQKKQRQREGNGETQIICEQEWGNYCKLQIAAEHIKLFLIERFDFINKSIYL